MTLQPVLAFAWNPAVGIPLLIVGVIVLALIWLFGQPKKEQGKRRVPTPQGSERREPTLGDAGEADAMASFGALDDARDLPAAKPQQGELDVGLREELEKLGATVAGGRSSAAPLPQPTGHAASIVDALRAPSQPEAGAAPAAVPAPVPAAAPAAAPASAPAAPAAPTPAAAPKAPPRSELGRRPPQMPVERIVTLFLVAREGSHFNGADLIVAAEKAGLEFGDMGIYHRLVDGKRELGPIFSVANMLKPGNFDLSRLDQLRTPGLTFFMTLPAPIPALDAWDAMLPTVQRLAELLDGLVLDEERNALGRQRIAHIRDELRGWDRDHEGEEIVFGR
ncbi:cell division protein ZipA [Frateuria sp. Soil773]|uniref:cell division protein ZipA n=1 Tax=Frateuria sp. Soil773 TaxID=1736407 RepID=UPI0006FDEA51|nr:cell division protein ZipA [Frateuria sp. Soil773]KRE89205.1 cell division protein ZipA [Frateuria sp. Soil773]